MEVREVALRLKGHRATHPMASMDQLEHLVQRVREIMGGDYVMDTTQAMEGYTKLDYRMPVNADDTVTLTLWSCNRCGAIVGDHIVHNNWHTVQIHD